MLVHTKPASSPAAGLAASSRPARRGLRAADAGGLHAYCLCPCLPSVAAQPLKDLAVSVMTADHRGGAFRRPPTCRTSVTAPVLGIAFRPGRIRQGPSMYEMEGPCPASPHRLVSCLAWPTPRAARRGQVPARGPVSRLLPRSRGLPQVVPVSSGKNISTAIRERRARAGGQPFRVLPLSTNQSTESAQLSAFHGGYPRVYSHSIDRLGREPENAGTAVTRCNRLIFIPA